MKVFNSGNSQAIRIPKKFRLAGQTARIKRSGKSLIITPEENVWDRYERGLAGLSCVFAGFDRSQPPEPETRRQLFP